MLAVSQGQPVHVVAGLKKQLKYFEADFKLLRFQNARRFEIQAQLDDLTKKANQEEFQHALADLTTEATNKGTVSQFVVHRTAQENPYQP